MSIYGISLEKAEAIAEKFPSLSSLRKGLQRSNALEDLKNLKFISSTVDKPKSLGLASAQQILWFYGP